MRIPIRACGVLPRVLGHARAGSVPMQEAIRRMTSLPAERFGLTGRGCLKQSYADLVRRSEDGEGSRHVRKPKQVSAGTRGG
jgi:N-acyl-D-aspartate/D-glutamate deacylase